MPPKKEAKVEEPTFVDEVSSYAHEAEGARYQGGVRRYPVGADSPASASSPAAGKKGGGAAAAAAPEEPTEPAATALVYRHGTGTYSSPTLHYTGEWRHDKMEGQGRLCFLRPAGGAAGAAGAAGPSPPPSLSFGGGGGGGGEEVYEGAFHEGLYEGQGRYQWRDGSHYAGSWRQGMMHGDGVFTDAEGHVYKGKFSMGVGPGLARLYTAAGACGAGGM